MFHPPVAPERFHRITEGKRQVGRVYYDSIRQRWVGVIGEFQASASIPLAAFAEVGARVRGFRNLEEMHEHQKAVRTRRRTSRKLANSILEGVPPEERVSALDAWLSEVRR